MAPLAGYRRALRFLAPYWPRLATVLLAGIAATGFSLLQPYISKLLVDDAPLKMIKLVRWRPVRGELYSRGQSSA
jgi:ATP-binding cassette subfamily B protein